jgi:hypothetical protein
MPDITIAVKLVGGGEREARDQVFYVRYSQTERIHRLTRDYLLAQRHDADHADSLASYYRNIAMAIILSRIPWFRDTTCEVVPESALPTTAPHYRDVDFAIWGEPQA